MTFVDGIIALSDRFLREQTFELVVAPAVADFQFDEPSEGVRRARNAFAVLSAFGWGVYEDVTSDSTALTFGALVLIPACYYTVLVAVCAPDGARLFSTMGQRLAIAGIILVLSLAPAIACFWPERRARRASIEAP